MLIEIKVVPNSKKRELILEEGGRIKVKLTAPPVNGKANKELVEVLSEYFGVPKRNVTIVKGEYGRKKLVKVEGI